MLFAYTPDTNPRDIRNMYLFAVTPQYLPTYYVTCWGESPTHADERASALLSTVWECFTLELVAVPWDRD